MSSTNANSLSDASETVLVQETLKKIEKAGDTAAINVPSEVREYLDEGDEITLRVTIKENLLEFLIRKPLYNFGIADVRKISDEHGFKTNYDSTLSGVTVLESTKDNLTLNYTQNREDVVQPAHVAVSKKIPAANHDTYNNVVLWARPRKHLDVLIKPDGDLDTINILQDPEYYRLTREKAFKLLTESGKRIGVLAMCRFDSKNNTVDEIKNSIDELSNLNP